MLKHSAFAALEAKFADGGSPGQFEGYAAVFGHADTHGDVIVPGAFAASLAARKAAGRAMVPMYANHGPMLGGDTLPVGVWRSIEEDDRGLKVSGEISGMDTDHGRRIYGLVKSGALGGLSIGYRVLPGGSSRGDKAGDPKRTLKRVDLMEISLVDDPSQAQARVEAIKSARGLKASADLAEGETEDPADSIAVAMRLVDKLMSGDIWPSAKPLAQLMDALQDAYALLTGEDAPLDLPDWRAAPRADEAKAAYAALAAGIAGFTLPSFG